ncbi:MAG: serine protease, partial [Halobacteriovoraceae bacterium]|nr:serine protease [Halobacteriovoraceae bacterium]
ILASCQQQETIHLRKSVIKKIYPSIVEVIIPKLEDKNITYQRPLPFDQLDYKERNDKYHAIGTAFFITPKKLISAAHVLPADEFSVNDNYFIRTSTGTIHKVKTIYRYSSYRDLIEFDLESYPLNPTLLKLQTKVEIGDMVYAVGNAQGEGISTRGGQVSTFTPEPVAGEWNYIRFSSPASPGNSGGPLVNSKGEVVGVIVMKNNSENLNFALPVSEIKNTSTEKAHFFSRQLKVQDGMQVTTKDWTAFKKLPSTFLDLRKKITPEKDLFYGELIGQFKKDFKSLIFPNNVRFRDSLLYQRLYPRMSMVDKDRALHDWRIDPIVLKKIIVSKENILYHAKGDVFNHYVLFKKGMEQSVGEMINNPRNLINRILIASGAHRYMAGQSIPIIDRGNPDEVIDWKDVLGRPWKTSLWITKYNNTMLASHCTVTPEGVYCFFDQSYASQRQEGYLTFVKENILEINLSYTGTPQEWIDFQKLPKELKPSLLEDLKFQFKNNVFS